MQTNDKVKKLWDSIYDKFYPNYGEAANFLTSDKLLFKLKDQHEKSLILWVLRAYNIDTQSRSVLDLGCGTGRLSFFFEKLGSKVIGVDISRKYIGQAKSFALANNSNVRFVESDAVQFLAHLDCTYDIIVISGLCYLYTEPELLYFFSLLHKVMVSKSLLIIKDHIAARKTTVRNVCEVPSYFRPKRYWMTMSQRLNMEIDFFSSDLYLYSVIEKKNWYSKYLNSFCKFNSIFFPFDYISNKIRSYIMLLRKNFQCKSEA